MTKAKRELFWRLIFNTRLQPYILPLPGLCRELQAVPPMGGGEYSSHTSLLFAFWNFLAFLQLLATVRMLLRQLLMVSQSFFLLRAHGTNVLSSLEFFLDK